MLNNLINDLQESANLEQANQYKKFFKTAKGEYGEGDIFLGVKVPVQRQIAKKYSNLNLIKIQKLLNSKIHEYRFISLILLTNKYKKAKKDEKANIFNFYLNNTKNINNWDLVDVSCTKIVGDFLSNNKKNILYDFANSKDLWKKRIAIVSTWNFIKQNEFQDTLTISEILLKDKSDLIQKAVGWMLREVGKKDQEVLENFLKFHYKKMPRTTLRYSIEKFDKDKRKKYLQGKI